jgi:hypothetical protein
MMAGAEAAALHHRANEQGLIAREPELVADLLIGEAHVFLLALDRGPVEVANGIAGAFLIIVTHAEDEIAERGDHLLGHADLVSRQSARHGVRAPKLG